MWAVTHMPHAIIHMLQSMLKVLVSTLPLSHLTVRITPCARGFKLCIGRCQPRAISYMLVLVKHYHKQLKNTDEFLGVDDACSSYTLRRHLCGLQSWVLHAHKAVHHAPCKFQRSRRLMRHLQGQRCGQTVQHAWCWRRCNGAQSVQLSTRVPAPRGCRRGGLLASGRRLSRLRLPLPALCTCRCRRLQCIHALCRSGLAEGSTQLALLGMVRRQTRSGQQASFGHQACALVDTQGGRHVRH